MLKPVNLTEAQVHEFMNLVSTNPNSADKDGRGRLYAKRICMGSPQCLAWFCLFCIAGNKFIHIQRTRRQFIQQFLAQATLTLGGKIQAPAIIYEQPVSSCNG